MDAPAVTVSITDLQPSDIILVKSPMPLSPEQIERAFQAVAEARVGHRAIVLDVGISLEIVRPEALRAMQYGDLFAGIGGWIEDGDDLNRIAWLTFAELPAYQAAFGSLVHVLDEAS